MASCQELTPSKVIELLRFKQLLKTLRNLVKSIAVSTSGRSGRVGGWFVSYPNRLITFTELACEKAAYHGCLLWLLTCSYIFYGLLTVHVVFFDKKWDEKRYLKYCSFRQRRTIICPIVKIMCKLHSQRTNPAIHRRR